MVAPLTITDHAAERVTERGVDLGEVLRRLNLLAEGLGMQERIAVYLLTANTDQDDCQLWAVIRGKCVTSIFWRRPRTVITPEQFDVDEVVLLDRLPGVRVKFGGGCQ